MFVHDRSGWRAVMNALSNDTALEEVFTHLDLGSYQVRGRRGHELNLKWQG